MEEDNFRINKYSPQVYWGASSFLTCARKNITFYDAKCGWKRSIHFSNPRTHRFDSKKKKERKDPFPRYLPSTTSSPSSLLGQPADERSSRIPAPRRARRLHVSFRGAFQLQTRWIPASGIRIPVDGPSYCEYRFQPGKKQICPRLLLPSPKEKQSRSVCAGLENIYICIRKRDIFSWSFTKSGGEMRRKKRERENDRQSV